LCHAALARPPSERAAFLADACADDELRREAESLLASPESSAAFLERPIGGSASLVGRQLGAYRLEALIGAGGMGEVYRAIDTRLGRQVAVKILPAAWAEDPHRRTRFEREARAVAALNHPNICTLHDVGHDQGIDFLVMEFVEGESLATRLAKGPLPLDQALAVALEIADALDNAHGQGIVHRDLKPGNVMMAPGSGTSRVTQAKLLDFGLARLVAPPVAAGYAARTASAPVTEAGGLLGTLQYMAPEQIEGGPADARTDIFALGLLLYEMLTGRHAFEGSSTAAVMAAILRADPPQVQPREVDRVVRRCLAKDPLRRYQTARDAINDLEEVQQGLSQGQATEARTGRRFTRRSVASLGAVLVAAIAVGSYAYWIRPSRPATVTVERFQLQPPSGVEVLASGSTSVLAISPDGQWVAFRGISRPQNEIGLYLRSIRDLDAKKVAIAGTAPFFSADSRWLAFFAEDGIFKVPVDGGRPAQICRLPNITSVRGASWGDRETIVFSMDRALWLVAAAGGEPVQLTHPASDRRHYWPSVLPGSGAAVVTVAMGISDRWRQLGVVSLKTGDVRMFSDLSGTAPRYVAGGYLVYSRFGELRAAPFDLSRLEVTGKAVKVLDNTNSHDGSGAAAFDVSASGSLVFISGPASDRTSEGELVWLDRRGTIGPLSEQPQRYMGGALDAAGKRLVVSIGDYVSEGDLSLYEMDRGAWTRLTTGMQTAFAMAWSPDGEWIFFTSFKSGEGKLFRMPSRGGAPEQLTFDRDSWDYPTDVSPDGASVLYVKSELARGQEMILRLEPRGTPQPLTRSHTDDRESAARVSPDGRWVAYVSDQSGSRQIHVVPLMGNGESIRVSPTGGMNPRWNHDGRELLYEHGQEIWTTTVEPGATFRYRAPRMLLNTDFLGQPGSYIISAGSDRFVAIRRRQTTPVTRMLTYVPKWLEELKHAVREPQ
jgi:eukaryotic-like serine/threonine-protein kinase